MLEGESVPLPVDITLEEGFPEDEDCKILLRTWLNERMAPSILPYAEDVVNNVMELISNQV